MDDANDIDAFDTPAFDSDACEEAYDTLAAGMGIWAATHPSTPGAAVATAALATHLVGQAACNGGIDPGSPPDFLDAKLGFDPAQKSAPAFTPDESASDPFDTPGFDYAAEEEAFCATGPDTPGFDYAAEEEAFCATEADAPDYNYGSSHDSSDIGGDSCLSSFDTGTTAHDVSSGSGAESPGDSTSTMGD